MYTNSIIDHILPDMSEGIKKNNEGIKYDSGKPDYSLLPFGALDDAVKTLTYGAKKYSRDNWRKVPDFHNRYLAAAFRHITSHARGETFDPETGCYHLSHAIVSLMYLVEDAMLKNTKKEEVKDDYIGNY
jgi:hypothetical protein